MSSFVILGEKDEKMKFHKNILLGRIFIMRAVDTDVAISIGDKTGREYRT